MIQMNIKAFIIMHIRQIICVACFTSLLNIHRNLMLFSLSLFTSLISIFILTYNIIHLQYIVLECLIATIAIFVLIFGMDMSNYKTDHRIQNLFILYQVSQFSFTIGLVLSKTVLVIPILLMLLYIALH